MKGSNMSTNQTLGEFSSEYVPPLLASFATFLAMMYFASPALSAKYFPTYNRLSNFGKADWNTRVVSNVNAVIVSFLSVYAILTDEAINLDKVWGTSHLARCTICIISGYLLADLIIMVRWFPLKESWQYFIHHIFVLFPFLFNVVFGALTFFANSRITAECSTLFVNMRWFLNVLDHKSSKWYVINGLTMAAVFFVCRIAVVPFYYAMAYQNVARAAATMPILFIIAWLPSSMVMDVLNTFWFYKIYKGAVKVFSSREKPKEGVVRNRVKGE